MVLALGSAVRLLSGCSPGEAERTSPETRAAPADGAPKTTPSGTDEQDATTTATDASAPGVTDAGADHDAASEEDAGPPAVGIVGRVDTRDQLGPRAAWPGVTLRARFEGAKVEVTLDESFAGWMSGAPSEWSVVVDGVTQPKLVTKAGVHTYSLATNLGGGPHTVELVRRSEAQNGVTQFRGFGFGQGGVLLPPPLRAKRRIEVIGDSSVTGYGVEGVGYAGNDCPGVDHAARWQDFGLAWGSVVARAFQAEVHATAYSGKGLVRNIWRPDTDALAALYWRANPLDSTSNWSTNSFVPDVIATMFGANDFAVGQPDESGANGPATLTQFQTAYRDFVGALRAAYPDAHLFLGISPTVSDAFPTGRTVRTNLVSTATLVAGERATAGDLRVHVFQPGVATGAEATGCGGHATGALHARIAGELAALIRAKLGW
jgi:lysophospholipase L1-like esterase